MLEKWGWQIDSMHLWVNDQKFRNLNCLGFFGETLSYQYWKEFSQPAGIGRDAICPRNITHSIHVWKINLHFASKSATSVGKYSIHGMYGLWKISTFFAGFFFHLPCSPLLAGSDRLYVRCRRRRESPCWLVACRLQLLPWPRFCETKTPRGWVGEDFLLQKCGVGKTRVEIFSDANL